MIFIHHLNRVNQLPHELVIICVVVISPDVQLIPNLHHFLTNLSTVIFVIVFFRNSGRFVFMGDLNFDGHKLEEIKAVFEKYDFTTVVFEYFHCDLFSFCGILKVSY